MVAVKQKGLPADQSNPNAISPQTRNISEVLAVVPKTGQLTRLVVAVKQKGLTVGWTSPSLQSGFV